MISILEEKDWPVDLPQIAIIKTVGIQIVHVNLVDALKKKLVGILNVIVVGMLLFHQSQQVHRLKWADTGVKLGVTNALTCKSRTPLIHFKCIVPERLLNDLYGNV